MTFDWYDDKIEKSILLALGMGFLGALGIKGLNKANEKSLVNKIINNPELIDELNEFKRKYDANPQAPLSSKTALNNAIEEIGIDKLRRIANQEMERLNLAPKMIDLDEEVQRRKAKNFMKGDIMKEDNKQKEMRLRKELAKVRAQNASESRKITKNRDFSVGGIPPDTTHKRTNTSNDVPDAILLPSKRRGKKENIPF